MVVMSFFSCEKDTATTHEVAYLGGEIINPKQDFVVIIKSDQNVLDTLKLDINNRFIYKLDSLTPGLYTFRLLAAEGMETQMVLLEPRDSIMFRLNTVEFDESLVYTGKGAKKNNYLIQMFLDSENDAKDLLEFSQLSPEDFAAKIDSIRKEKLKRLKKFDDSNTPSNMFDEIAKANINYDYYLSKELYPFINYSKNEKNIINSLPADFYDYRKDVDYNYELVGNYYPYYNFLKRHIENVALTNHFKNSKDSIFNRKCLGYNINRLNMIDSLVKVEPIKNDLMIDVALKFISDNKNIEDFDPFLQVYNSKITNPEFKEYISNSVESLKRLKPGNYLPDLMVYQIDGSLIDLKSVAGNEKPKVLYFWSQSNINYFHDCHKKAMELKTKYPEFHFIAVNTSSDNVESWRKTLAKFNVLGDDEFLFENMNEAKKALAIYPMNKVMILDRQGKIINPHTNMFSFNFEEQLLGLLNQ